MIISYLRLNYNCDVVLFPWNKNDFIDFNISGRPMLDDNISLEDFYNFRNHRGIFVKTSYLRGFL